MRISDRSKGVFLLILAIVFIIMLITLAHGIFFAIGVTAISLFLTVLIVIALKFFENEHKN
jgi:hypothetical protein